MAQITINNETLTYDNIIYVDSENGDDINGDGSENNPYYSLSKACSSFNSVSSGCIVLKKGTYSFGDYITTVDVTNKLAIVGQKLNTTLQWTSDWTYTDWDSPANLSYTLELIDMVYDCNNSNDGHYKVCVTGVLNGYNVVFENIGNPSYGYFYGGHDLSFNLYTSLETSSESPFVRHADLYIENCYGYFYSKDYDSFNSTTSLEPTTTSADVDENYNILESGWENTGTGTNPDGSTAHIGVYGGAYAWGDWINLCHLFRDGTDIKTYDSTNNTFNVITSAGSETESDFLDNGINSLANIPLADLQSLGSDVEVLTYTDYADKSSASLNIYGTVNYFNLLESNQPEILTWTDDLTNSKYSFTTAIPNAQLIVPNSDIDVSDIQSINSVTLTSNLANNGIIKVAISKNSGSSWQYYDPGTSSWSDTTLDKTNVANNGMTPTELNNLTTAWDDYITDTTTTLRFAYYLEIDSLDDTANNDLLKLDFDAQGRWEKADHMNDYHYYYDYNNNLTVELYADGSYKINYDQ